MPRKQTKAKRQTPDRIERRGFRLDEETKDLIERATVPAQRIEICVGGLEFGSAGYTCVG